MDRVLFIRLASPAFNLNEESLIHWGVFSLQGDLLGDMHVSVISTLKADVSSFRAEWRTKIGIVGETVDVEEELPERACLVLPGEMVVFGEMPISSGQKRHLRAALPYLLEEYLLDEVEDLHFSYHLSRTGDKAIYVGITHKTMETLLNLFNEQGIYPESIVSENQLLEIPKEDETASVVVDENITLLSAPDIPLLTVETDTLQYALIRCQSGMKIDTLDLGRELELEKPKLINKVKLLHFEKKSSKTATELDQCYDGLQKNGWHVEKQENSGSFFEWLVSCYFNKMQQRRILHLRHGAYRSTRRSKRKMKKWRPVFILFFLWLFVELGYTAVLGFIYRYETSSYWTKSAELYLDAFPSDKQVTDAKANDNYNMNLQVWLQNRMRSMGPYVPIKPFLSILNRISAITDQLRINKEILSPKSLEFDGKTGKLIFEFNLKDKELAEKFIAALQSEGFDIAVESLTPTQEGVLGKVVITRG